MDGGPEDMEIGQQRGLTIYVNLDVYDSRNYVSFDMMMEYE